MNEKHYELAERVRKAEEALNETIKLAESNGLRCFVKVLENSSTQKVSVDSYFRIID